MNRFLARPTLGPEARAAAIGALRFIAFAYTYHYLNWFSKTGIIRWHVVSQRRIAGLVALWLVSLALYAWSWQWGYVGLLGLSVAHVILEYPLNWKTFIGIGGELRSRLASRPAAPA